MTEPAADYRTGIVATAPRWLQGFTLGRLLYAMGLHIDVLVDGAAAAVKKRFPGLLGYGDEIEVVGAERGVRRGPEESDEAYTARMRSWLDDRANKGGPYAMLNQVGGFFGDSMVIELVYRSGARFTRAIGGAITRDEISWMATPPPFHTWWLVMHWPVAIGDDGVWDDPGTWDDGGLWDFDAAALDDVDAVTTSLVARDWNRGDAFGYLAFLSPGVATTDPPTANWTDPVALAGAGVALIPLR